MRERENSVTNIEYIFLYKSYIKKYFSKLFFLYEGERIMRDFNNKSTLENPDVNKRKPRSQAPLG